MTIRIKKENKRTVSMKFNELIVKHNELMSYLSTDSFSCLGTEEQLNHLNKIKDLKNEKDELEKYVDSLEEEVVSGSGELYLSDIIDIEKPKFKSNNLIVSPVGSGKTTLITERLVVDDGKTILMLVSNSALKDATCPINNDDKELESNRMFTTQNKSVYGEGDYKIHVMTYHEFGIRITEDNKFLDDINQIYCDEIHSLPEYKSFNGSESLAHALKYLFSKQEGKQIFYFTGTDQNIIKLMEDRSKIKDVVTTFDYRDYPNIKKFTALTEKEINHSDQIEDEIKSLVGKDFSKYGYKGVIYTKLIVEMKSISKTLSDSGFRPLLLWSVNNTDHPLSKEQLEARAHIIKTGQIPEGYDFLVMNSSMREGWNLNDRKVELVIINTSRETDIIQARGRVRKNISKLIYRVPYNETIVGDLEVPEDYLNRGLSKDETEELSKLLNVRGQSKRLGWRGVKSKLEDKGYNVKTSRVRVDGKRKPFTTISI